MTVAALARMVRLSHSVFALPFAVSAVALLSPRASLSTSRLALTLIAVIAARTAAMAMNRLADRAFDARNPRTAQRELVTGVVTPRAAMAVLVASSAIFVAVAALISPLSGALALPVLGVLLGYSYAKRFTWAVHLWLGLAQALGPVGVAIALTGTASPPAILLGLGVGAWVAGFDILYSIQDAEFDRGASLHSIPSRFGIARSLGIARWLHVAAALLVASAGIAGGMGVGWMLGTMLLAGTLVAEHRHVAPGGRLMPERINAAFFTYNAVASIVFSVCAVADRILVARFGIDALRGLGG